MLTQVDSKIKTLNQYIHDNDLILWNYQLLTKVLAKKLKYQDFDGNISYASAFLFYFFKCNYIK